MYIYFFNIYMNVHKYYIYMYVYVSMSLSRLTSLTDKSSGRVLFSCWRTRACATKSPGQQSAFHKRWVENL